jgi:glycosyltransferase involved in cell wall biosynthesis
MATPRVSIVTPTLNQGRFIEATIRSIKTQTYSRLEHIVVDGGSTDETLAVLRRHEATYPMRWISEPDKGMYDALNKGMASAAGDILAYLNSDDLYFPWTLEAVVQAFEAHPDADVVFGDALGVSSDGRHDIRFQPPHRYEFLLHASSFVQPAVFWRRAVADEVGPFDASMRLAGDLDFFLRMGRSRTAVRVDEVLAIERDHALTQRSQQWNLLMSESSRSRAAARPMSAVRRRVLRSIERFKAWIARRALWLSFAREVRHNRHGSARRWRRFLEASRPQIDPARIVLGQLPWIGRRFLAGAIHLEVDWLTPAGADSGPADGGTTGKPRARLEPQR